MTNQPLTAGGVADKILQALGVDSFEAEQMITKALRDYAALKIAELSSNPLQLESEQMAAIQSLTVEEAAKQILNLVENHAFPLFEIPTVLEAYAAQQNAELVADHKKLHQAACDMIAEIKAENERLKLDIEALEKENRECRAGLDRDICLNILRNERTLYQNERDDALAENERLKQQLAWQPIETLEANGDEVLVKYANGKIEKNFLTTVYFNDGPSFFDYDWSPMYGPAVEWLAIPQPPKEAK